MLPHQTHCPHSSTTTLGQSSECNPPLPLKLAMDEELRTACLTTFIKECCFPPPQPPCCPSSFNTCCGLKPSDEVKRNWSPSLSSRPHSFTCHQPGKGSTRCCHYHQPMGFKLGFPGEQRCNDAIQTAQHPGSLVIRLEMGHTESANSIRFRVGSFSHHSIAFIQ